MKPVEPGEMNPERLRQIAEGAAPHPAMRIQFTPEQFVTVAVTDTCIGALDYGANALARLGAMDVAAQMQAMRNELQAIGKRMIDAAARAHRPPNPRVEGAPEIPTLAEVRE